MIISSLLVGMLGAVAARLGVGYVAARGADRDPHVYWVLGLAAPAPAWLIVFWVLLGPSPRPRPDVVSAASWTLSAAAGLLGAIVTEGLVRRVSESAGRADPLACWRLGLAGFLPAWGIALLGYGLKALRD